MSGGKGPGQAGRAGPDGLRADRHPAVRAAGQQRGRMTERGLDPLAAGRADRSELPAGTGVRGDQELLAHYAVTGLRAHRHDRVARGDDAVDGLEGAALLLSGIGVEGDRGQRQLRRDGVRGPVLVSGERAELRPMTGQQRQGQDSHRHQHDGRHHDRRGAAAEQAGAGPPGGGHAVVEQEGVVRPSPAVLARPGRGHQVGRTFPDRWPVVAPPVVPVRAVILVDPGVGKDGRAQRDAHGSGPAGRGRLGRLRPGVPASGVPRRGRRVGRGCLARELRLLRGRVLVLRLRRSRALPLDTGRAP